MMEVNQGMRITTWNVNGIRNPFSYQPWRQQRTFAAMFDILEADIVVLQETKIQRKDLRDDMVLVSGWDVYFSLPKFKKGYSGVAIYTRNAVCAPIRAEEGITGILSPPGSSVSFCDLPEDQKIGGYPTLRQLSDCSLDAATLDCEGRCVVLEFPAFVLIGVYCPANRDETRDEFRLGFLMALDARVRNLVAMGKRVILTGDLNIIREEIDTANVEEQLRRQGITLDEYFSSPARRILNQLLVGGRVFGKRDEGREHPVLWDVCRSFHPGRRGMFTCWEQKINARPGNFGSRIDYLLCSENLKNWFCESNIQEGLMGSDHCPVYAVLKDKVDIDSKEIHVKDIVSNGMFKDGVRLREWSSKDLLLMSAKLIPEFDRRRSIRDMFTNKASVPTGATESNTRITEDNNAAQKTIAGDMIYSEAGLKEFHLAVPSPKRHAFTPSESPGTIQPRSPALSSKRLVEEGLSSVKPVKRSKTGMAPKLGAIGKGQTEKGQSSLIGFFKPKTSQPRFQGTDGSSTISDTQLSSANNTDSNPPTPSQYISEKSVLCHEEGGEYASSSKPDGAADRDSFIDPIVAKESWSKLLGKRNLPRCEHNEPCISLLTKKPGVNCGRSFYICARPLGPSGQKETNSNWRCGTFIWSSDWAE